MKDIARGLDDVSRRGFLSRTALSLLGVGAMPALDGLLHAQDVGTVPLRPGAPAKNVIYLNMDGGMSHLDTFDLKPGAKTQGPIEGIRTNAEGVLVHKLLARLAKKMNRVCVVNSMTSTQGAHEQAQYYVHTSYMLRGTIKHPTIGAWMSLMMGSRNPALPPHVSVLDATKRVSAGFMESKHGPLPIRDPQAGLQDGRRPSGVSEAAYAERLKAAQELDAAFAAKFDQRPVRAYADMYDQATRLMASKDLEAFDLRKEPSALREAYGMDPFGQGVLLARRLIEHRVRCVEVQFGGWDTHYDNFDTLERKLPVLDAALASLLGDLESRGLLDETLVVVATEFGRTPDIRVEHEGRDHYPKAFTCLLAGGGIRGGRAYGRTDPEGREAVEKPVQIPDFNATIAHALGLPLGFSVHSPSGRPFTVADKGTPILELF
ncbi:MAG TPA: DUF1501 domain-containing protein [Planctomycetota bacterium]|nr:DUF1501 domain-containing protein [Planctomycetota bacterium]